VELFLDDPAVDVSMDIPKQDGLDFDVNLNLQNHDELHLSAGKLWVSWFPCTDPERVASYRDSVHGLLSGTYRIVEHYRGTRPVKAQLQRPDGEGWKTISTSSMLFALPWGRSKRVIQNTPT
jgi:hypothetical protein